MPSTVQVSDVRVGSEYWCVARAGGNQRADHWWLTRSPALGPERLPVSHRDSMSLVDCVARPRARATPDLEPPGAEARTSRAPQPPPLEHPQSVSGAGAGPYSGPSKVEILSRGGPWTLPTCQWLGHWHQARAPASPGAWAELQVRKSHPVTDSGGFLGKMRPIWAICKKSGQKCWIGKKRI